MATRHLSITMKCGVSSFTLMVDNLTANQNIEESNVFTDLSDSHLKMLSDGIKELVRARKKEIRRMRKR